MSENSVNQPSLSARELAHKIMILGADNETEQGDYEFFKNGSIDEAASLIDQAFKDAANPYKEAFEELVEAYKIQPHAVFDNEVFFRWSPTLHCRVAPLTRALLTQKEKSE